MADSLDHKDLVTLEDMANLEGPINAYSLMQA